MVKTLVEAATLVSKTFFTGFSSQARTQYPVIGEPPSSVGAVHETEILDGLGAEMPVIVGAPAQALSVVPSLGSDQGPQPSESYYEPGNGAWC